MLHINCTQIFILHTNLYFCTQIYIFRGRVAQADINKNSPAGWRRRKKSLYLRQKMMLFIDDKEAPTKKEVIFYGAIFR